MEPAVVGTTRTFRYLDQQLIVRTTQLSAVSAHFGVPSTAPTDQLGDLTRIHAAELTAVYDRLPELAPDQSGAVAPNYVLQPWVSSGGGGWPAPSTAPPVLAAPAPPVVPVVVFDSGLISGYASGHPQLANVKPGTGAADVLPSPGAGAMRLFDCHGTFVAGVLGCAAPAADVRVLKVFDSSGGTDDWSLAVAIDAFLAANHEVRLVNLSCGTFADRDHPPLALFEVVRRHPKVLFVAAAGNLPGPPPATPAHSSGDPATADAEAAAAGSTWAGPAGAVPTGQVLVVPAGAGPPAVLPAYPAAFDSVIGVGSATPDGTPAPWTDLASSDVFAAGIDVHNAFGTGWVEGPAGAAPVGPFAGTATWRGTSFAAPLATGLLSTFAAATTELPAGYSLIASAALAWLRDHYGNPATPATPILLPYPVGH